LSAIYEELMSNTELSKTYAPEQVEQKWYSIWEQGKYFCPKDRGRKESFTIIMPPPNVTGRLHMGHALDVTTQDTLIRYKRMKGYEALWLPGMDHAGIATQSVVEKNIWEEEKKTRKDYTRKEFVDKIWKWKEEYGGIIANQQRSLGASPDWNYFLFTMDEEANQAVKKAFVMLYQEGLIYQADYIINWSPELQSAISDAEVEHKEVKGAFYHILYKVKDENMTLEVATTRPETLLGDTAVAVNPKDKRFKHLIGKKAIIPICNREVPIIGDDYVDMEKGTGCLKVTPGHDFNDFDIGKRHQLPLINILNLDGTLNEYGLEFKGLSCKKARKPIIEKLKELNQFVKTEEILHQVGHCSRSNAVIEPMVSKQWFLNVQDMAETATKAVKEGRTTFYPNGWQNTYYSWLNEPRDWCISRQLWWGHQIPVFNCQKCHHQWASEAEEVICAKCKSDQITQDPDVLDTWFSSGLWPFSTLGWPNETRMKEKKFETFFPTSTLITGYDIIFFWVARMMMMSLKITGKIPFKDIYIHAIVRDKLGRKMSKSLGNGIDPLEMIKKYGADALRFTLAAGSGYNRNLNLDPERIEGYRNFINKIWNAYRFILPHLNLAQDQLPEDDKLKIQDRWILDQLKSTAKLMNDSMDEYRFDDSCSTIYAFVYDRFCSWYIELSKSILSGDNLEDKKVCATVLKYCFKNIVALLHPFIPYLTEELWSSLKTDEQDLLIIQQYPCDYPKLSDFSHDSISMHKFTEVISAIRNLRASVNIKPKDEINVHLFMDDQSLTTFFENQRPFFLDLAKSEVTFFDKNAARPEKSIFAATIDCEIFIPLDGVIDLNDQIKRIEKEKEKIDKELMRIKGKLKNQKFMDNAPESVVEEVKTKEKEYTEVLSSLNSRLRSFKN